MFPELKEDSVVHADPKLEKTLQPLPLDPEETGLLTVVKNSRTIAEVYESSFLKRERIRALLFAYWLCGLMTLESAEEVRRKTYEASFTPKDHEARAEVRRLVLKLSETNYYQWLSVHPNTGGADILKQARALLERFSLPSLERAFQDERREDLQKLVAAIEEARSILTHPDKRMEYDQYLASGKTGSFVTQSAAVRVDATIKEAQTKLQDGNLADALRAYEEALR